MRKPQAGRSPEAGFSLLELMAVIFVIGMSLGMVSLAVSTGNPKSDVWDNIEKFIGVAEFASERAVLAGETMGLILEPPEWQAQRGQSANDYGWRYRWVTSSREGWKEVDNLPAISLPESMHLTVLVDDKLWKYEDQVDRAAPVAAYYSSGDISQIEIEWTDEREPGFTQHILVNESGELVWKEAPEPPEKKKNVF
jgi:general secretion pathway protein H